jgi:hypothetical protein
MESETKEIALNGAITEAQLLLEELRGEAEGWRQRNLITDSQLERQERAVSRLEAVAAAWEAQLAVIADLDRLDVQVRKLTARILEEAVPEEREQRQGKAKDRASNGITVNYRRAG